MQQADHPEELLDLVDNDDNVIGTITRKEVYAQSIKNYRCVHAFIQNSEGKLWIPRRVSTKKLFPDALDFSIAGHVEAGETYEEALVKEAAEEVRLTLAPDDYQEVGYLTPYNSDVGVFQKVFLIKSDKTPAYDEAEFQSYEWLTPQEIVDRFAEGEAMKDDIPKLLELCGLL